jgi:hypothetical protein
MLTTGFCNFAAKTRSSEKMDGNDNVNSGGSKDTQEAETGQHPMFEQYDGSKPAESVGVANDQQEGREPEDEVGRLWNILGDFGIGLGVCALGLAVVGLALGMFRIEPLAQILIFFSLLLGTTSMIFGMVFQAFGASGSILFFRD